METKADIEYTKFANEYINNGGNARLAYKAIKPKVKDSTADVNGCRLLKNTKVKAIIKKLQEDTEEKALITRAEVIDSLKRIAKKAEDGDDLTVARACWQDLGKTVAAFTDNIALSGEVKNKLTFQQVAAKKK